jgi:hypothetical protein
MTVVMVFLFDCVNGEERAAGDLGLDGILATPKARYIGLIQGQWAVQHNGCVVKVFILDKSSSLWRQRRQCLRVS